MKKAARKKKKFVEDKITEPIAKQIIEPEKPKKTMFKKIISNKPALIGGIIILIIIVIAGVIYAISYFAPNAAVNNSKVQADEVKKLIDEVGEKFVLPQGETPTIATVTDVEKLASQPFFKDAQNGDKVIIYGNAKQAILYRPSIQKIIAVSSINGTGLSQPQNPDTSASASAKTSITPAPNDKSAKVKIAILNSTKEAGLAKKASALFDDGNYDVTVTANAVGEYGTTTVSVINKSVATDAKLKEIISQLSKVNATAKNLPTDESAPAGSDVVIILGSDFSEAY